MKILQLHLMDFLYLAELCENFGSFLFTFLGSTPHNSELLYNKNHISLFTQRIFILEDSPTGGFIAAKIFPEETFVQKRPLGQE